VPHAVRLMWGRTTAALLPMAIVLGAFLIGADLVARMIDGLRGTGRDHYGRLRGAVLLVLARAVESKLY
jgi:hypothetical protein